MKARLGEARATPVLVTYACVRKESVSVNRGPQSPPINWDDDILGMSSNRVNVCIDAVGNLLPDAMNVELTHRAPNKILEASRAAPIRWTVPRDGRNNRYFLSGYLGDACPFLSQQPSGLRLATIRRNDGESDAWFRRSGNWLHRGAGVQPGPGGLTSEGWKRTGNINSEVPDAMSLLLSGVSRFWRFERHQGRVGL